VGPCTVLRITSCDALLLRDACRPRMAAAAAPSATTLRTTTAPPASCATARLMLAAGRQHRGGRRYSISFHNFLLSSNVNELAGLSWLVLLCLLHAHSLTRSQHCCLHRTMLWSWLLLIATACMHAWLPATIQHVPPAGLTFVLLLAGHCCTCVGPQGPGQGARVNCSRGGLGQGPPWRDQRGQPQAVSAGGFG
jgi:hypothetical protein